MDVRENRLHLGGCDAEALAGQQRLAARLAARVTTGGGLDGLSSAPPLSNETRDQESW